MTKTNKNRGAKKVNRDKTGESQLPQRSTKDIAEKHAQKEIDVPQQREAMKTLGTNEQGKELFDFVLKGLVKPDKK